MNLNQIYQQDDFENYYLGEFRQKKDELNGVNLAIFQSKFQTKEEMKFSESKLDQRKDLRHQNLVRLTSFKAEEKSTWCSSIFQISSSYEYFPNNLQKEIVKRQKANTQFSSNEILRIVYDLIDVLAFLQTKNIINYHVVPTLIYLYDDIALCLHRVKLLERLNVSSDKRVNITSAIASNFGLYLDPNYFEKVLICSSTWSCAVT